MRFADLDFCCTYFEQYERKLINTMHLCLDGGFGWPQVCLCSIVVAATRFGINMDKHISHIEPSVGRLAVRFFVEIFPKVSALVLYSIFDLEVKRSVWAIVSWMALIFVDFLYKQSGLFFGCKKNGGKILKVYGIHVTLALQLIS